MSADAAEGSAATGLRRRRRTGRWRTTYRSRRGSRDGDAALLVLRKAHICSSVMVSMASRARNSTAARRSRAPRAGSRALHGTDRRAVMQPSVGGAPGRDRSRLAGVAKTWRCSSRCAPTIAPSRVICRCARSAAATGVRAGSPGGERTRSPSSPSPPCCPEYSHPDESRALPDRSGWPPSVIVDQVHIHRFASDETHSRDRAERPGSRMRTGRTRKGKG